MVKFLLWICVLFKRLSKGKNGSKRLCIGDRKAFAAYMTSDESLHEFVIY